MNIQPGDIETRDFKLIACNIFMREVGLAIAGSIHRIDPLFTEVGDHLQPDRLRSAIQAHIDTASQDGRGYDAVLLAYGLCGNATVGLTAGTVPLVIPRAHDCCTILLGSRQAFYEHFGDNPSQPFSSAGYMDRGDYYLRRDAGGEHLLYGDGYAELVELYGEDNAAYIREAMRSPERQSDFQHAVFIEIQETAHLGHAAKFAARASAEGKTCLRLSGDLRLLRALINGNWPEADFLVVPPGHRTIGRYDRDIVIDCQPCA